MRYCTTLLYGLICWQLSGQITELSSAVSDRLSSVQIFDEMDKSGIVSRIPFENIGPTVFSGRVVDVEVDPDDPTHFYVAYASGGLWETVNNGTTFKPIFDHEAVMTIGDLAVDWTNNKIWVGSGEVNSSRSSYAGTGMYASTNNGESWSHLGLDDSHHIGKVLIHPDHPDIISVAVLGHLYTENQERGVFRSIDGGETWTHTLYVDNRTGAVDLIHDPLDPDVMYAALWERERKAWDFIEAGDGSGIFKSIDGGVTWTRIISDVFPSGKGVGRIGLSTSSSAGSTRIYALLDNYYRREAEPRDTAVYVKADFAKMSSDDFATLDGDKLEAFLRTNRFPTEYTAESVKKMVSKGKVTPPDLTGFLEDANSLLFDTPVKGAELYATDDGGKTWRKTHEEYIDNLYNSYGYYFGVITANPINPEQVYIAGVPILRSDDGGKSFKNVNGQNVHVDHHRIWINPANTRHVVLGNDGGINISYDEGDNWIKCNSPEVGQFYYICVDMDKPYNVYGGTQDNGVWKGSKNYSKSVRWHNSGRYPYESLLGGDGMQVQVDTRDNNIVYTGFQFGNYFRIDATSGERTRITPIHDLGARPYRWNWQTPIHLSTHNQDILYMGANSLFRSMNQGEDFTSISGDLTLGGKKGDVPFGTLTTIHESPLRFGLLYTGSDDGQVHVSKDGGTSWQNLNTGIPNDKYAARVQASAHSEGRVYLALNGYRDDDFAPYLFKSEDYGQGWEVIGENLPKEPINVIKEDPHHEDILYIGSDRAAYVSLNMGTDYMKFSEGLPNVPIHDLVIHARDKEILLGTHGRSIYKADLTPLYEYSSLEDSELAILTASSPRYSSRIGDRRNIYSEYATNKMEYSIYSNKSKEIRVQVHTDEDLHIYALDVEVPVGISYHSYNLSIDEDLISEYNNTLKKKDLKKSDDGSTYLRAGKYKITIEGSDPAITKPFEIRSR